MKTRVTLLAPPGRSGGMFFVVPFDVEKAFGKQRAPVVVTIGKVTYRTTIAIYGGTPHIGVRAELRAKAGVGAGDTFDVVIEPDRAPRVVELPKDMRMALKAHPKCARAWEALSYSHQKEHVDWLTSAKQDATRARRIAKWLDALAKMPPPKKPAAKAHARRR